MSSARWTSSPAAAVALAALAAALYVPRLGHELVTDDAVYIVENPAVTRGAPLAAYFLDRRTIASNPDFHWQAYRPLRTLAFRAIYAAAGPSPLAFGLANLSLYVLSALLLFALAVQLGTPRPAALAAAALWVAAPVHVEPVLYASALGDHLSLALELGALSIILRGWPRPRAPLLVLAWLMVAAALLAKEMAVTAPALIALLAWATGNLRRAWRTVAAHVAAALLFVVARTAVLGALGHGTLAASGLLHGVAVAPVRLVEYLRITLAPLGHRAAYVVATPPLAVAASWLMVPAAVVLFLRAGRMARLGFAWFVVALLPVLGLVPLLADLADRFALLPSVGLALAAPAAGAALAQRWPAGPERSEGNRLFRLREGNRLFRLREGNRLFRLREGNRLFRLTARLAPALLLILYCAGSAAEGAAWATEESLWAKAVALEPRSSQAQRNLGLIRLRQGRPAEALRGFDEARALGEMSGELDRRRAMALEALERFDEAERAAAEAVAREPGLAGAQALLGGLLARRGELVGAERAWQQAARLEPAAPSTLLLEAELARRFGDFPRALAALGRLIARYPAEPRFRHRRGVVLLEAGQAAAAAEDALACLRLAGTNQQCSCLLVRTSGGACDP